jgi:pimeloyl-ACP methyl ester carboxylesterase
MPEGFARHTEMALNGVLDLCIEDGACAKAFPDPKGDLAKVKARLAKGPITASYQGHSYSFSPGVVASTLRSALYAPDSAAWIPFALHNLAHGDDADLAAHAVNYRRGITSGISDGLYLSIVCAEDFPLNDLAALHRDEAGTLYGSFRSDQLAAACALWPHGHDLPALHQLKTWQGPVLVFSGQYDPVTPTVYAERVISQFPNGRLIRTPNQGHGATEAANNCMIPLAMQFVRDADASKLDARCTEGLKFPAFQTAPSK